MIYTDLAGRYFDWLYERVCGDWEPRGLSFHRLLTFLYNQNFTPSCELDGARAEDGLDLRYRFAQTQNVVYQDVQDAFAGMHDIQEEAICMIYRRKRCVYGRLKR